jgi:alpha-acetolactate decarboxylase
MKTKSSILTGAAIAALIATTTLTSVASNASVPSSPAERAATADLNRAITLRNNAADDQYRLLMAQHQEQMRQNEIRQQQYQAQLQNAQDSRDR